MNYAQKKLALRDRYPHYSAIARPSMISGPLESIAVSSIYRVSPAGRGAAARGGQELSFLPSPINGDSIK